jgi:quercetin dioxygenase-like cupin family protein
MAAHETPAPQKAVRARYHDAVKDRPLAVESEVRFRAEGPYTKKLVQTERTIVMIVCLEPGQVIPPHSHVSREAFVHCLRGSVRFTPGEGPPEVGAGEMRFYDGASEISPRNVGDDRAVFLVTLVRKKSF